MIPTEHMKLRRDIYRFSYVRLSHRTLMPEKAAVVVVFLLATLYLLVDLDRYASYAQQQTIQQDSNNNKKQQDDLVLAESTDVSTISHVINIDGWPSVNQMWPTTNKSSPTPTTTTVMLDQQSNNQKMPFIFSDKARKTDYDLLLSMNQTMRDNINNYIVQSQVQINLSFEYYFDHDLKVTALPAIKVDVDRVQFKNLIPTGADNDNSRSQQIPIRQWVTFNEQLPNEKGKIADDWLKISLVNRESPSLVAMRKLKLEFLFRAANPYNNYNSQSSTYPPMEQQQAVSVIPSMGRTPQLLTDFQTSDQANPSVRPSVESYPSKAQIEPSQSASDQQYPRSSSLSKQYEHLSADIVPKRQNRLVKRDAVANAVVVDQQQQLQQQFSDQLLTLTCYNSRECDWLSASEIQWSLASMPPANDKVRHGYYYNSNQFNYGDPSKILDIYLSETELATKAHQLSDHCVDLALYVSGDDVKLRMVRLNRENTTGQWAKGNPTVVWSSTTAENNRASLPNSTMVSIQSDGWIEETICFNEFFGAQNCGAGQCAIGFEMITNEDNSSPSNTNQNLMDGKKEVLVAVALSSNKVTNVPIKTPVARWLNTWQRPESNPKLNWNFRPKSDWQIDDHNVTLLNLYDGASYTMTSDWLEHTANIDLTGFIIVGTQINDEFAFNKTAIDDPSITRQTIFAINVTNSIVDSNFSVIHKDFRQLEIDIKPNSTDHIYGLANESNSFNVYFVDSNNKLKLKDDKLFKLVTTLDISVGGFRNKLDSSLVQLLGANLINFSVKVANVSVSDRCYPSPCSFGGCDQTGTGLDDWDCKCQDKYWGRRCNFGKWCDYPHVTPQQLQSLQRQSFTVKTPTTANLQANKLITGDEYCLQKLGNGFNCTNMEVPLDENSYDSEGKTFRCSCQSDYYLSDDSRCRQAHKCNSIMCPSIGMTCDITKPFNETRPCHCDESQDWYEDPLDTVNGCVRKQCHNRKLECGFDAHICLPTVPGEKPICKCADKFRLEIDSKDGTKSCKSTACLLPSLNDCDQICLPNDNDRQRPYTCACHPGFRLASDQRTCRPMQQLSCRPLCQGDNQICTQAGCKCKPGYLAEGETVVDDRGGNSSGKYTQSVRCLNVCSTSYAENRDQFDKIQQVCPLGLCDPGTFKCRCSDGSLNSLLSSRYEPRLNESSDYFGGVNMLGSPLCRLRRVCTRGSNSYNICTNQGAICVPDYSKASMFDCVCPPSTEKKFFGQGTINEFTCEPKCAAKRYDCLRQQAVCKLLDKDKVGCDCLPGFIHNQTDHKCFIAKYSYSFQLLLVNKYYDPESRYHRLIPAIPGANGTQAHHHLLGQWQDKPFNGINQLSDPKSDSPYLHPQYRLSPMPEPARPGETNNSSHDLELLTHEPQLLRQQKQLRQQQKSIFLTDLNQCNITTLIPKTVLEDPYESDLDPFVDTIEECNARIHDNVRKYRLNSDLVEDVRQSLRQIIYNPFTVTINNSQCYETDKSGQYLNCTIYLQSNSPVEKEPVERVFSQCDSNSMDNRFCWIKPRILLQKLDNKIITQRSAAAEKSSINFRQIIPCELDGFCGLEAQSVRMDNNTSYCSCKCPENVDVIDVKDLLPRHEDPSQIPVKQICAPINHCLSNSTFCLYKPGSACHYDVRSGTQCRCIPSSYENKEGHCVEVASSELDNTLIILVILLGTALVVSVTINLIAAAKSEKFMGKSKGYPLREFSVHHPTHQRSAAGAGLSNPAFLRD